MADRILKNTNFIKMILMLFVMLGHSMAFWSGTWITEIPVKCESIGLDLLYGWINSFHVYAFTAIAGIIFALIMFGGGLCRSSSFLEK